MPNIALTANEWVLLPIVKAAVIRHRSGSGNVIYAQSVSTPTDATAFQNSIQGETILIDGVVDGELVYAKSLNHDSVIVVSNRESNSFPDGAFSGTRAITMQDYAESNKKLGNEWEASIRIVGALQGDRLFTILKIGSLPVDLKSRVLGATGSGVIGRIYELFSADITAYGTKNKWYNMRFDLADPQANSPEVEIYPSSEITFSGGQTAIDFATDARRRGADLILETTAQNQGKGYTAQATGSNRIFYANKIVMLEIESLDAQNISSRLEIYEGELDLPL